MDFFAINFLGASLQTQGSSYFVIRLSVRPTVRLCICLASDSSRFSQLQQHLLENLIFATDTGCMTTIIVIDKPPPFRLRNVFSS